MTPIVELNFIISVSLWAFSGLTSDATITLWALHTQTGYEETNPFMIEIAKSPFKTYLTSVFVSVIMFLIMCFSNYVYHPYGFDIAFLIIAMFISIATWVGFVNNLFVVMRHL